MKDKLKEKDGKFYQECDVVMLPTNKKEYKINQLCIINEKLRLAPWNDKEGQLVNVIKPQHLYFLSNEEIKEGDWYILLDNKHELHQFGKNDKSGINFEQPTAWTKSCKKIIATTDNSLLLPNIDFKDWDGNTRYLPQPSKEFIQAYIKAYNENKPIIKVLVECYTTHETDGAKFLNYKVNSFNEITIKKIKDSYTREKVIELCKSAYLDGYSEGESNVSGPTTSDKCSWSEWLEENL